MKFKMSKQGANHYNSRAQLGATAVNSVENDQIMPLEYLIEKERKRDQNLRHERLQNFDFKHVTCIQQF